MYRFTWVLLICGAAVGCHIEDCGGNDEDGHHPCGCDDEHDSHGSGGNEAAGAGGSTGGSAAGGSAAGGSAAGGSAATGNTTGEGGRSGAPDSGQAGAGGSGPSAAPTLAPCSKEADCAPGFNCDLTRGKCTPSDSETCPELADEAACGARPGCKVVYAGVHCSCGPDCHCIGGEAGCICESFEYFRCEPASGPS
jgi:hypothetical protein